MYPVVDSEATSSGTAAMTIFGNAWYLHVLIVLKSGSLNLLEPSGPVQACNGIALPLPYISMRFGSFWGTFWSSIAAGISVQIHHQNFFVIEVSLQAHPTNYLTVR